jgi:hypothetical protein
MNTTNVSKSPTNTDAVNQTLLYNDTPDVRVDNVKTPNTNTTRTKFQSMGELLDKCSDLNTDDLINTDSTQMNDESHKNNNTYEFSLSTLNRKLKKIKKEKKKNRTSTSSDHICIDILEQNQQRQRRKHERRMPVNNFNIMMNPSKLINEHLSEIQIRIIGHTRSAIMYEKREKILGYPVTILSSFLTSSIMMGISNDNNHGKNIIKYISLTLAILSFIFSVSRDYLNFAKKFQSHDLSSKLYTSLLRSTEVRLVKSHLSDDDKRDVFKDILDQMSIIEQYETPITTRIETSVRTDIEIMNS